MLLIGLATAPALARDAPSVDGTWGDGFYEDELVRYRQLVGAIERRIADLVAQRRAVELRTERFLGERDPGGTLQARYAASADALNRSKFHDRAVAASADAVERYRSIAGTAPPPDGDVAADERPEGRAERWPARIAVLEAEAAQADSRLAAASSREVVLRGYAGLTWGESIQAVLEDSWEDLVYVAKSAFVDFLSNVADDCTAGFLAEGGFATLTRNPMDLGAAAGQCLRGAVFDTALSAWFAAFRKDFIDRLSAQGVPAEIAAYWWQKHVDTDEDGLKGFLQRTAHEFVTRAAPSKVISEVAAYKALPGILEQVVAELRRSGQTFASQEALLAAAQPIARERAKSAIAEPTLRQAYRALFRPDRAVRFDRLLLGPGVPSSAYVFDSRSYQTSMRRLGNLFTLAEVAEKTVRQNLLKYLNYRDWDAIAAGEIARFREIRACLAKRGDPADPASIIAILEYDVARYAEFRVNCDPDRSPAYQDALLTAEAALILIREAFSKLERFQAEWASFLAALDAHELDVDLIAERLRLAQSAQARACRALAQSMEGARSDVADLDRLVQEAIVGVAKVCIQVTTATAEREATEVGRTLAAAEAASARLRGRAAALDGVSRPEDIDLGSRRSTNASLTGRVDALGREIAGPLAETVHSIETWLHEGEKAVAPYFAERAVALRGMLAQERERLAGLVKPDTTKPGWTERALPVAERIGWASRRVESARGTIATVVDLLGGWGNCPSPPSLEEGAAALAALRRQGSELLAATRAQGGEARACVTRIADDLVAHAGDSDAAKAAIAACRWDEARAIIARLPDDSTLKQGLGNLYNERVESAARAQQIHDRALADFRHGRLIAALAGLAAARDRPLCTSLAEAIARLTGEVVASAVEHVGTLTTHCEFDRARALLAALPQTHPQVPRLAASLREAEAREAAARRDLDAGRAALDGDRAEDAVALLERARDGAHCRATREAASTLLDRATRVAADLTGAAAAAIDACDAARMRQVADRIRATARPSEAARKALSRIEGELKRGEQAAALLAEAEGHFTGGRLKSAGSQLAKLAAIKPPPRCGNALAGAAALRDRIAAAQRSRADLVRSAKACQLDRVRLIADRLADAGDPYNAATRDKAREVLEREARVGTALDRALARERQGDLSGARQVLQPLTAGGDRAVCDQSKARIQEALARIAWVERIQTEAAAAMSGCDRARIDTVLASMRERRHPLIEPIETALRRHRETCRPDPALVREQANTACATKYPGSVLATIDLDTRRYTCKCDGPGYWNSDRTACLSPEQVRQDGERFCASIMQGGVLAEVIRHGHYRCDCASGLYKLGGGGGDRCLTRDQVIADGRAACAREGRVLVHVVQPGNYRCCPPGTHYDVPSNQCRDASPRVVAPPRPPIPFTPPGLPPAGRPPPVGPGPMVTRPPSNACNLHYQRLRTEAAQIQSLTSRLAGAGSGGQSRALGCDIVTRSDRLFSIAREIRSQGCRIEGNIEQAIALNRRVGQDLCNRR